MQIPLRFSKLSPKSLAIAGLGLALVLSLVLYVNNARAGVGLGVSPSFPTTVNVGDTNVPVTLAITNNSDGGDGVLVDLTSITLIPSCGANSGSSCTSLDPGVFNVDSPGTGSGACVGRTFTIAVVDAPSGKVSFTPDSTVTLGLTQTCTISFTVDVLSAPDIDSSGTAGLQTKQVAEAAAIEQDGTGLDGGGFGTDTTTVNKASPGIQTTPTPASGNVGDTLNDTASLTGGSSPTGSVTFKLFPPADSTCIGTASYTDTDPTAPYATSPGFVSNAVGTWHWTADYAGDANNNAVSSGCVAEPVTVNQRTSTVTTHIHDASHSDITDTTVTPGTVIHDNASVTGGGPTPTGTVDFQRFANSECTGDHVDQNDVALVAGVAESSNFTTVSGALGYIVHYDGDTNYSASDGTCEPLTISKLDSTTVTNIHDANHGVVTSVNAGDIVHDNAVVSGSGPTPTGTVDFMRFATNDCSGSSVDENDIALSGGSAESLAFTTTGPMSYRAHYDGDTVYNSSLGACEPLTVIVPSEYCSPGYWKQAQHFDSWVGYSPTDKFSAVFGETITIMWSAKGKPMPVTDPTLLQVLEANGGGVSSLARAAVGALLNASALDSSLSTADVIQIFQDANPSGDFEAAKAQFTFAENCPLN